MTNENKAHDKYNRKTCVSNYIEKLQSTYSNLIYPFIFYTIRKFKFTDIKRVVIISVKISSVLSINLKKNGYALE